VRDVAAHRHSRSGVQQGQYRIEDRATHVLEADIDAARTRMRESLGKFRIVTIDAATKPTSVGSGEYRDVDVGAHLET
jgi:hypothetical protein